MSSRGKRTTDRRLGREATNQWIREQKNKKRAAQGLPPLAEKKKKA